MRSLIAFSLFVTLLAPVPVMAKNHAPSFSRGGESCIAGRHPPAQRWRGAAVRCVRASLAR